MNKKKNGFTLIELLAVIVILGILMAAVIPGVTNTINKSRRKTFLTNAEDIITAVRNSMSSGEVTIAKGQEDAGGICQFPGAKQETVVNIVNSDTKYNALTYILEKGGVNSSFQQEYQKGYVIIVNDGTDDNNNFKYYISLVDKGKNGIGTPAKEDDIVKNQVGLVKTSNGGLAAQNSVAGYQTQYTCEITE